MIYLLYLILFYLVGVIISAIIITYDNWLLSQYPTADIKFHYKESLLSWAYIFIYIKSYY